MMTTIDQRRSKITGRYPEWPNYTIGEHFVVLADEYPRRPMVLTNDRTYSYSEMMQWAERLARGFMHLGLRRGDRVAILMPNSPEFIALRLGIALSGGITVPINTRLKAEELSYIVEQSDATFLVACDRYGSEDRLALLDSICPQWEADPGATFSHLKQVIVSSSGSDVERRDSGTYLADVESLQLRIDDSTFHNRRAQIGPHDVVDIVYTSGSTGLPKGVMLTHNNVLCCSYTACLSRAMKDGSRVILALPLYHNYGHIEGFMASSWVGGASILRPHFDAEDFLSAIARFDVNDVLLVPTMAIELLNERRISATDLSSVSSVMCAAASAPTTLWREMQEAFGFSAVVTGYGQTELTSSGTYARPEDPLEVVQQTVGRLKPRSVAGGSELGGRVAVYRVIDPVTEEEVPLGRTGELIVKGPQCMLGYYRKPKETSAVFIADGWMRTGDMGYVRSDGNIALTGRSKELYKCGGELVSPREVEEVLASRADIRQAFVVGVPDGLMGEVGFAFVVPAAESDCNEEELLDHCRAHLARFKVPQYVVKIDSIALPTTSTGKVQKFRLAEIARQHYAPTEG